MNTSTSWKAVGMMAAACVVASASVVGGCAASGGGAGDGSGSAGASAAAEEGVIHTTTAEERAFLKRTEPLTADRVVLHVNGMGCPLCVTNVDKQLLRLRGVKSVQVDLGAGTVDVGLEGSERPSPARLDHAVADAGNTLAKITIPK